MALISYRVDLDQAHKHYFQITLTIPTPAAVQELSLPSWIPGSYLLREFARHLSGLRANQGSRSLAIEQLDKSRWQLRCSGRTALVLRYRVYAFDNSVRSAFLDAQRGFFNGSSLLLKVHGREGEAHQLSLGELPPNWAVATSLPQTAPREFLATNYDDLLDHPFELGQFWQGEFEAGGVRHRMVVSGALPSFDGERLLRDSRKICESQIALWHGPLSKRSERPPFGEYLFMLNAVDEGYGGLEHGASTALIAPRRNLPRHGQTELNDGYVQLLGLISHEYFHAWNVKRLKPAEFARLDYGRENYTELLWFFEGFTSYYDDLTLVRSGLIDEARYLKLVANTLSGVLATPGRQVQSLARSSFDAWIKYYRPDENTVNATISYYGKGALLALATDLSLRSGTVGHGGEPPSAPSTLDALMRGLWQRSRGGPISEADILAMLTELASPELAEDVRQWVHGTADLPLPALLERFGVQWQSDKATVAQRLGLRVNESAMGGVQIKQVLAGSLAQEAGLSAGDELLGCNGWRLRRLDDVLLSLSATQTRLEFLLSRDQRLLTLALDLPVAGGLNAGAMGATTGAAVLLSPLEKPAVRAASLRRAWLLG